ncbi:MAG: hypothetical protein HZC29_00910 [Thaumarchaeota archaeon]|nr:hypothetical protein [Nitrososphaerota archaeon]
MMNTHVEKTNEYWILDQKCKLLLQEDEIRFAGIINRMGRLVAGGFKKGITPLVDNTELQRLYLELTLRVSMRQEFDDRLGPVKYTASYREKALVLSFLLDSNILLISTSPDISIDKTANKIMRIVGLNGM